jgi:magnesium chelatase family protein
LTAAAVLGVESVVVSVEVDVSPGLPGLTMVGLPDTTVRESRDRVRTAIRNCGFPFPPDRITVSLAPADIRKVGAAFDLPIALGVLAASGVLPHREDLPLTVVGGLALDGTVPPMRGLLPIAISARRAQRLLMFPSANMPEAAVVDDLRLLPVGSLVEAVRLFVAPEPAPRPALRPVPAPPPRPAPEQLPVRPAAAASDVVDLRTRVTAQPRRWNLWDLERRARDEAQRNPLRYEEWTYLFVHLRQFATPDGSLPTEFDELVRESFGELLEHAH